MSPARPATDPLPALLAERFAPLQPVALEILDESHLHAGHAATLAGGRHFRVRIRSARFVGCRTLERHRLVYDCVRDLMPHPLHALAIEAGLPSD